MRASENTTKLIAFYLPQFHPISENDAWWGKGFTEWRNVVSARPLFRGHYQPHLPSDLGFYDLRLPETRQAQAELAETYGIHGFCYYHYWFNGKQLLIRPFDEVLKSGKPNFPFCLCWANENWTRKWDGLDSNILLGQEYNHDDDLQHIRRLLPAFEDQRYIRVCGKPMFLVYRTALMPDPKSTAEIWREEAIKSGLGDLFLVNVTSIGKYGNPQDIGFDASVEFAPDWCATGPSQNRGFRRLWNVISSKITLDTRLWDYDAMVRNMLAKPEPDYTFFRCVTPSWDKTARRPQNADVFLGSSPDKYAGWLSEIVRRTRLRYEPDYQFIFVNAWNEWAEGCHLEPDQKYGRSYLEATARALGLD